MQLLATAGQMQQYDRSAMTRYSLPGIVLMENAGRAAVEILERHQAPLAGKRVTILCGKGNNGGDGFVVARHLANRGSHVYVGLLCKKADVKGDARSNLNILAKMSKANHSGIIIEEIATPGKVARVRDAELIVDAIFGTGFSGEVKGVQKFSIEWINRQNAFVCSMDIASGVNATTGVAEGVAVQADLTVTMGLPKLGQYLLDGRTLSGMIDVADISIPRAVYQPPKLPTFRVAAGDVRSRLPGRPHSAHKNSVGRVLVIAGSRNLSGAPFIAAQSALRAGAGAVVLATPKSLFTPLTRKLTEVMVMPLDETEDGSLSSAALESLRERFEWADVIALGPGLSLHEETQHVVRAILASVSKPIVLDADGIGALQSNLSVLKKRKADTILTPHVGELRQLIGIDALQIERNRVEVSRKAAKDLNAVICLKGSPTATAVPGGTVYLNSTGNPGMATAGAGDVLTGVIASFVGQGMSAEAAAYSGVYVHGLAGDFAEGQFGERSLMALDILNQLPLALQTVG